MKERLRGMLFGLVVFVLAVGGRQAAAQAAVVDITVPNNEVMSADVMLGDTGKLLPQTGGMMDYLGQPLTIAKWSYSSFEPKIVRVDGEGNYQALASGQSAVYIRGYNDLGEVVFNSTCWINVHIDMTNVTLAENRAEGYTTESWFFTKRIGINSAVVLNDQNSSVTCSSENPEMSVKCTLLENELQIETSDAGKTRLFVTINGKTFEIELTVTRIEISKRGYVASKGKVTKLRVKGVKEKLTWTSSNAKVVKVSGDGTIRCRKTGNAVITASLGDLKVGCAVSVVSPKLLKVINRAKKIGVNWKYSQPKRMQSGYYDCSSLVWRSYKLMGKTFGMRNYAPVAADEAKWCTAHGKRITKSYTRNHIQKMKLRPGDLMFETGQNNGRYKGIYHVEMFVGYAVAYYYNDGTPVINELWAARPEGYYGGGHLIMRP